MQKFLLYLVVVPVFWYLVICITMFLLQGKLLFFPQNPENSHYEKLNKNWLLDNIHLQTPDGYILDGWMQNAKNKSITLLYFWGNAEESSYFVEENTYEYANIVSFNYRGYGNSTGSPSEKALFDDALLIYDFLVTDKHIKPENIIVMGRSLGSGVATYLASQKPVKKVILVTPYDSIESVAKESYGFVPVSLLLQNKFDSTLYANLRNNELLCIYGGMDTVVPNSHTERLLTFWKGSVQKVFLSNANHNSILSFNQVQTAIDEFVQ